MPNVVHARHHAKLIVAVAGVILGASRVEAQVLGSTAEDRARLAEILGRPPVPPPSVAQRTAGFVLGVVAPDVRVVWNSALPFSLNDGPLWAGRGLNASVTTGAVVGYDSGPFGFRAKLAPTFLYSANRPFDIFPGRAPGRSFFSSPWHTDATIGSADLPLRFGNDPLRAINIGESTVSLRVYNVLGGVTNESAWWGPAIYNTLVLSNNAAGIPRAFLKTFRPMRTPIGSFAAEAVLGTLTKSLFFDTLAASDYRSFNAIRLAYHPPQTDNFTIGFSRAVYTPQSGAVPPVSDAFNVVRWRPEAMAGDTLSADQISSLFWRWIFPETGFEVYGEFARTELPRSLSELFQTPYNTGGYTLGLQWAVPQGTAGPIWRMQTELTSLGQNVIYPDRPRPVDFYTGRAAPQGYTQRGQIIGAGIGPGSDAQFLAVDRIVPRWQAGVFIGRVRWEDNALYRQQFTTFFSHDVTVFSGVRGALRLPLYDLAADLKVGRRLNYLFQNGQSNPNGEGTVSVQNVTLGLRISPR